MPLHYITLANRAPHAHLLRAPICLTFPSITGFLSFDLSVADALCLVRWRQAAEHHRRPVECTRRTAFKDKVFVAHRRNDYTKTFDDRRTVDDAVQVDEKMEI
jgi:predicted ATPase